MYEKILIATDGSEPSRKAEAHGLALAKILGAAVTILYVVEIAHYPRVAPGSAPEVVEERIKIHKKAGEEIVGKVVEKGKEMGVEVHPVVVVGHPANEIIEHARGHDIVVMGTLGLSGLSHLLMGSVAEKVVRHAPVPVLVIRSEEKE